MTFAEILVIVVLIRWLNPPSKRQSPRKLAAWERRDELDNDYDPILDG